MAKEIKEAMVTEEVVEAAVENAEGEVVEETSKRKKILDGLVKFGKVIGIPMVVFGCGFACGKKAGINAASVTEVVETIVDDAKITEI